MAGEHFQPIAVRSPASHPWAFRLRCLVDLQLATIARCLRPAMQELAGDVLDVGAGQSPWREWLPPGVPYQGIDVGYAADFGMQPSTPDVVYYDGTTMPLESSTFDAVLCIEVLEHAPNPQALLLEMHRVMRLDALLLLTVPWSARRHHIPHDFYRFTREGLAHLLDKCGFVAIEVSERGNDIAAIANKLTVLSIRMLLPKKKLQVLLTWPLGLACGLLAGAFTLAAHICIACGWGAKEDPLGYFVRARKGPLLTAANAEGLL